MLSLRCYDAPKISDLVDVHYRIEVAGSTRLRGAGEQS